MTYFLKLAYFLLFIVFKIRYKIRSEGLEEAINKRRYPSRGILFLPNHPTIFVDPLIMTGLITFQRPVRPVVIDYIYDHFTSHWLMRLLKALRVPNIGRRFEPSQIPAVKESNIIVVDRLSKGDNFLIYPAGQCKDANKEIVGGSSAVHEIVQKSDEINIVLVRIKGLYGSSFSRYWQGRTPAVAPILFRCLIEVVKNCLIFTPKREVIVEFYSPPADFPYKTQSRLTFNRYLEDWYNQPDGLTEQEGILPGDSTMLISLSAWKDSFPKMTKSPPVVEKVALFGVPKQLKNKVLRKIADLSELDLSDLHYEMKLGCDVGMDSLEIVSLIAYLTEEYGIEKIHPKKLNTIKDVIAYAYNSPRHKIPLHHSPWPLPPQPSHYSSASPPAACE